MARAGVQQHLSISICMHIHICMLHVHVHVHVACACACTRMCIMQEYTIEISLLASRLLGVDLETLRGPEPRKRPPFWQPLKPFLRVLADALRRLGED
jgi:hypothetical protein